MNGKTKKIIGYSASLLISLAYFILAVFVFQSPDGVIGFILCCASVFTFVISLVNVLNLISNNNIFETIIELIFSLFDLFI